MGWGLSCCIMKLGSHEYVRMHRHQTKERAETRRFRRPSASRKQLSFVWLLALKVTKGTRLSACTPWIPLYNHYGTRNAKRVTKAKKRTMRVY